MHVFNDIYNFAINVLYSLGSFCDGIFEFMTEEISVIGQFEFSVFEILFGSGLTVLLIYKIGLSLIPIA